MSREGQRHTVAAPGGACACLPYNGFVGIPQDIRCTTDVKQEMTCLPCDCREAERAKLKPHTVSPRLAVPTHIMRPPYVDTGENPFYDEIQVHDAQVH